MAEGLTVLLATVTLRTKAVLEATADAMVSKEGAYGGLREEDKMKMK